MPRHNLVCKNCGLKIEDAEFRSWPDNVVHLDIDNLKICGETEILWSFHSQSPAAVHANERTCVWYHPQHGYRYPGRNDVPMPAAYQKAGFERREMNNLSDLHRLEREGRVVSETVHYDKGTGRDFMGDLG